MVEHLAGDTNIYLLAEVSLLHLSPVSGPAVGLDYLEDTGEDYLQDMMATSYPNYVVCYPNYVVSFQVALQSVYKRDSRTGDETLNMRTK